MIRCAECGGSPRPRTLYFAYLMVIATVRACACPISPDRRGQVRREIEEALGRVRQQRAEEAQAS